MTKIEWAMLIAVLFCIFTVTISVVHIQEKVSDSGGVKQLIINAGKEVKDIATEIGKS